MIKNNKGFTMVELLATIIILGILSSISIIAYLVYKDKAIDNAYNTLSENAASAAEEYYMDKPTASSVVSIKDLVDKEYLSGADDPKGKGSSCEGNVTRIETKGDGQKLDDFSYKVELTCSTYKSCYTYPDKKKC